MSNIITYRINTVSMKFALTHCFSCVWEGTGTVIRNNKIHTYLPFSAVNLVMLKNNIIKLKKNIISS